MKAEEFEVPVKSPLSNLSETIKQVKESAVQYRETLRENEAATRAVLIDPILRALGWDTANIFMVEVEKTQGQTRVDYALYDRNGRVRFVVEAKCLDANLNDNPITKSIFTYAFTFNTKRIFLTDGLVWKLVTVGEPGNIDIDPVDFAHDSIVDCAAYLVQHLDAARFWPEEQTVDELAQTVGELGQKISELASKLVELEKEVSRPREPEPQTTTPLEVALATRSAILTPDSSTLPANSGFVELDQVENLTGRAPSRLRLPDGRVVRVNRWRDILYQCCKFALGNNPDISIPLPDTAGKKVHLLDTARPKPGLSYIEEQYHGRTIYIYTNYDANNCVRNAAYVLKQAPSAAHKVKAGLILQSR